MLKLRRKRTVPAETPSRLILIFQHLGKHTTYGKSRTTVSTLAKVLGLQGNTPLIPLTLLFKQTIQGPVSRYPFKRFVVKVALTRRNQAGCYTQKQRGRVPGVASGALSAAQAINFRKNLFKFCCHCCRLGLGGGLQFGNKFLQR